jgi:hypothetical protein
MATQKFLNNSATTLNGAITDSATSIVVTDGTVFSDPASAEEYYLATIDDSTNLEIVKITDVTTNTLTVVRGQEGTSGTAFGSGVAISSRLTAGALDRFVQSDPDGDARGTDAVNIQPSRTTSGQVASGADAIAIGADTTAAGIDAIVIGNGATATSGAPQSIVIGSGGSSADNDQILIGGSITSGVGSPGTIAIGRDISTDSSSDYSVAIGHGVDVSHATYGNGSTIAIGRSAQCGGTYGSTEAIAIGYLAYAKGTRDVVIGHAAVTDNDGFDNIAIGHLANKRNWADVTTTNWGASQSYSVGQLVYVDSSVFLCVQAGTSGGAEPFFNWQHELVTDNTVVWQVLVASYSGRNEDNIVIGAEAKAAGEMNVVLGRVNTDVIALGSVAVGDVDQVWGTYNTVINAKGNVRGYQNTIIGNQLRRDCDKRPVNYSTQIGAAKDNAVSFSCRLVGPDYLPISADHDNYTGADTLPYGYLQAQATERTFFSPPVCLGVKVWQASTSYKHGETVTPTAGDNGYSYFAEEFNTTDDYYGAGTSGSGEPTWPTTDGGEVTDGDIRWHAVKRDSMHAYLPDYLRFIPVEVGFIGDEFTATATTQPTISWGISTDKDKWKVATITTLLTGAYSRQVFDVTNTEGSKNMFAELTVAGDGVTSGRVFWKGICVETLEV